MRVLIISNIPTPNNDALFTEIGLLPGLDLHVAYCAPREPNRLWTLDAQKGYAHTFLRGVRIGPAGHINPGVVSSIRAHRPDMVVLTGGYLIPTALLAIAAMRALGIPWCYWGEEIGHQAVSPIRAAIRSLLRRPLRHAVGVLAIGRRAMVSYSRVGISEDRIANFHYYADTRRFSAAGSDRAGARQRLVERMGIKPSATIFAFAGQFIYRKGLDTLLEAHRALVAEGLNSELVVAGGGPLEDEMRSAVNERGTPGVHFTGFLQPNELPVLFAGSDCFVLPSRSEGWGLVVSEAMAAGTPVISSDRVNAGLELIEDNESGFLFRAGDASDLARVMRAVVVNTDREGLIARVRDAVSDETVERAASRFLLLVGSAVRGERIGLLKPGL